MKSVTGVSVIVPVLNEADHLEAAVRAALSQDYSGEIEVILALGPSRDGTESVVERLISTDSRITKVSNPSGRTANALNLSINPDDVLIFRGIDGEVECVGSAS